MGGRLFSAAALQRKGVAADNSPPHGNMNGALQIAETTVAGPSEATLGAERNSQTIIRLIRSNSARGYMPSMLVPGKRESAMLRDHLAQAFGEEEVSRFNELHHAGLKVAGERMPPEFERASRHIRAWKDESDTNPCRFDAGLAGRQ